MSIESLLNQVPPHLTGEYRERFIAALAIQEAHIGNCDIDTLSEAKHLIEQPLPNWVLVCGNIASGISTVYGMFTEEGVLDVIHRIIKDRNDLEHWCFRYEIESESPPTSDDLIIVRGTMHQGIEEVLRVPDMTQMEDGDWVGPLTHWKGYI